jgi:hypothetical protein
MTGMFSLIRNFCTAGDVWSVCYELMVHKTVDVKEFRELFDCLLYFKKII